MAKRIPKRGDLVSIGEFDGLPQKQDLNDGIGIDIVGVTGALNLAH